MADFFRRYVLHNLGLKLLSLVLAVGLWVAVARDPIAEVAVSVPIEFHRIPDNLEILSESIPQALIRWMPLARWSGLHSPPMLMFLTHWYNWCVRRRCA